MHKNVDLWKKIPEFLATFQEQLREDGYSSPIKLFEVGPIEDLPQCLSGCLYDHRNATARSLRRQDGDL